MVPRKNYLLANLCQLHLVDCIFGFGNHFLVLRFQIVPTDFILQIVSWKFVDAGTMGMIRYAVIDAKWAT